MTNFLGINLFCWVHICFFSKFIPHEESKECKGGYVTYSLSFVDVSYDKDLSVLTIPYKNEGVQNPNLEYVNESKVFMNFKRICDHLWCYGYKCRYVIMNQYYYL